jgi:hypothetical protein
MWVFTKYGFFSAVCARDKRGKIDRKNVVVRSRRRDHLQKLIERFPELESPILDHAGTDYAYRIVVFKSAWQIALDSLAAEMDYDNFKGSVKDPDYLSLLHEVWLAGMRMQREGGRRR